MYISILVIVILAVLSIPFKVAYMGIVFWSFFLFLKALISYFSGGTGTDLFSTLYFDNE